jgi:hypothetical protein
MMPMALAENGRRRGAARLWVAVGVAFCLTAGWLAGCGKKGPPVAPRQRKPPRVEQITHRFEDGTLTLRWTVPAPAAGSREIMPAGFWIYQARRQLNAPPCEECPLDYEPIADIPLDTSSPGEEMVYREDLAPGFRYWYRVSAYSRRGAESKPSEERSFSY